MNNDPELGRSQPDPTPSLPSLGHALKGAHDASRRLREAINSGRTLTPAEDRRISEQLDLYLECRYSQKFDAETKAAIIKSALAHFTHLLHAHRYFRGSPILEDLPQIVSDLALDELSAGRPLAPSAPSKIDEHAQLIVSVFGEHIHEEQVVNMLTKVREERQVMEFQVVALYVNLFQHLKRRPRLELVVNELRRSATRADWVVDEPLVQEMLLRFSNRLPGPGEQPEGEWKRSHEPTT